MNVKFQKRMIADRGRVHWQPEHYKTLAKIYGVSEREVAKAMAPAPEISRDAPGIVTKSSAGAPKGIRWTMNDGEPDRMSDVVVAAGVDLSAFKGNPIALLGHNPDRPIGTWSGVHASGGKLVGTLHLADTPWGRVAAEEIGEGVLKAASIGFMPLEFEPIKGGGFQFNQIELMETSVVSIPASRGSLRERSHDEKLASYREKRDEIMAQQKLHDAAEAKRQAALDKRKRELAIEHHLSSTTFSRRQRDRERTLAAIKKLRAPK